MDRRVALRHEPLSRRAGGGDLALVFIALVIGGAFAGLAVEGLRTPQGAAGAFDAYLFRVARFSLWQALLSTAVSVVPGMLVARALSRRPAFPGRGALVALFAVPLALPAIVVALGVLALFGRAGLVAPLIEASGANWPGVYGLSGILVAHAFFNIPLAARLFLQALDTVPADQWRLAAQLGMGRWAVLRLIEWPVMRQSLPGIAGLVFMLCMTSFTIVLILGGGPRATTLEVAIYQSLRFDFDPARAVTLVLVQVALTVLALMAVRRFGADIAADKSLAVARRRPPDGDRAGRLLDILVIALAALFVAGPMLAILVAGLRADLGRLIGDPELWAAARTSLVLATLAGALSVVLALALVRGRWRLVTSAGARPARFRAWLMETGASMVLVLPPIVLGAGWFILLRHAGDVLSYAPAMVVTVNAIMALPFAMRVLRPAHDAAAHRTGRLADSLGMSGFWRLWIVDWPLLRRPVLTAFAFAMALSIGDLGVIALFGSDTVQTVPYLLLARMGSYRTEDAAGIALLLAIACLILMLVAEWSGRGK